MSARRHALLATMMFLALAGLLGAANPAPSAGGIQVLADLPYAGNSNPRQALDLYLPKNRRDHERLPVIVYIHGGGFYGGSRAAGGPILQPYVEGGAYAGVAVGYRLSGEACWPAQIHDCKAAIRWIRAEAAHYGLDPEKIGVMGGSAGGTLAALLGTSAGVRNLEGTLGTHRAESSRVTCVVNRFGRIDFLAEPPSARSAPSQATALAGRMAALFGAPPEQKADLAREASPVAHLSPDDPPILTIHGEQDGVVPIAQAEFLDAAMKRAGLTHFFIRVQGAGHGLNHPEEKRRTRQFFDRYLRGVETPISTEPIVMPPKKPRAGRS